MNEVEEQGDKEVDFATDDERIGVDNENNEEFIEDTIGKYFIESVETVG